MNLVTQMQALIPWIVILLPMFDVLFNYYPVKKLTYKNVLKKMNVHNVRSLQPITCKIVRGMSYESANVVIEMIRS